MAPFSPDEAWQNRMDWLMFQIGPVHIVRSNVFDPTLAWYLKRGYETILLDAARWRKPSQFGEDVTSLLDMPQDFWDGRNFNALDDCLSDVARGEGAMTRSSLGLCVGFRNFATFESQLGDDVTTLLRICARTSATASLFGNRWMWIFERDTDLPRTDREVAWFHEDEPPGLRIVN